MLLGCLGYGFCKTVVISLGYGFCKTVWDMLSVLSYGLFGICLKQFYLMVRFVLWSGLSYQVLKAYYGQFALSVLLVRF